MFRKSARSWEVVKRHFTFKRREVLCNRQLYNVYHTNCLLRQVFFSALPFNVIYQDHSYVSAHKFLATHLLTLLQKEFHFQHSNFHV